MQDQRGIDPTEVAMGYPTYLHITQDSRLHIDPEDFQTKGSESSHTIRKYLWCSIKVSLRLRDYLVFSIPRQMDVIEHSRPPNLLVANTRS